MTTSELTETTSLPWSHRPHSIFPQYRHIHDANGNTVACDVLAADAERICRAVNSYDDATLRIANLSDDCAAAHELIEVQREQIERLQATLSVTLDQLGQFFGSNPHKGIYALERAYVGLVFANISYGNSVAGRRPPLARAAASCDTSASVSFEPGAEVILDTSSDVADEVAA